MSDWHPVAAFDDVPEGGTLVVDCAGKTICLYNLAGEIFATDDLCSHGNASLGDGFIVDDCQIECPLHQGTFDIRTGKAVALPCKIDIATYPARVEGGQVHVQV